MMKQIKIVVVTVVVCAVFGCKSTKSVTDTGTLNTSITAKQLIRENSKQEIRFKTLQAKVKIDYTQGDDSQGYTVNLRIKKDETIWLSATLGLARAMITPDRVQFYDKINNQYFDGDYTLLSNILGVELDFKKVQNLLVGEAIYNLKDDTYKASTHQESYVLEPKNQKAVLELFYLINPGHFKMDSQQLYQPLQQRMLQVDYKSYQEVQRQIVPENIHISAVESTSEVTIDLEYKSVSLNEEVRFPFKIPSGFKEIIL